MRYIAEQPDDSYDPDILAEVIPLQRLDPPSFYQRNSGALPRIGQRSSISHQRAFLPSPVNSGPDGLFERIRDGLFERFKDLFIYR